MTTPTETHLATKEDVANVRTEIANVHTEIANVRTEVSNVRSELGWRIVGLFIAQTAVLGTILVAALNWASGN